MTDITDHEDEQAEVHQAVVVEPLPFPFADPSDAAIYMWCYQHVLQHADTPLNEKTLKFVQDSYKQIRALWEGKPIGMGLEVVK